MKYTYLKSLKQTQIVHHGWKKNWNIRLSYVTKMHWNCPPRLKKFLKDTHLTWLKMHSDCPPWLEKFLKYTLILTLLSDLAPLLYFVIYILFWSRNYIVDLWFLVCIYLTHFGQIWTVDGACVKRYRSFVGRRCHFPI